jgi:hypothetical protein
MIDLRSKAAVDALEESDVGPTLPTEDDVGPQLPPAKKRKV